MDTIYITCAALGGTLMLGQFLLGLFGLGHHLDGPDHDTSFHADGTTHDSSWFAGMLSFRAIVAAVTLFGLCGLAAGSAGRSPGNTFGIALVGGAAALFLVAQLMRLLSGLAEDGTAQIDNSIGEPATVYLTVPAGRVSAGKVHLRLQNRTVECQAVTAHPEPLPTGARVMVVAVIGPDTVEVTPEPAPPEAKPYAAG